MDFLVSCDVQCPHCGEFYELQIDTSQGNHEMQEDCTVCCRPIQLNIQAQAGQILNIEETAI